MSPRRGRCGHRRPVAALLVAALALGTLAVVGGGATAGRGWQVRAHLLAAGDLARDLRRELARGEIEPARRTLEAVQEQTRAARAKTTGWGWRLGARVPGVGGSLSAVGEAAAALDDFAQAGLPPLVEAAGELEPDRMVPRDGQLDLAAWQWAAPRLAAAAQAAGQARDRVDAIPPGTLLRPLREPFAQLRADLGQAAASIDAMARLTALVPSMFGARQERTYLVLFQNPAELRAGGGMPGALAVVETDRGAVRIVHQATAAGFLRSFAHPVLPLDPEMRALYTDRPGIYPANVNLTPHFPTSARLIREMYRRRSGQSVDGVLATDPVALSYLLRATGPVETPGGVALTAGNAVRVLLSEAYADTYAGPGTGAAHHEYFAAAAASVFDTLVAGSAEPRAAVDALVRAASERRILLWSADSREQRLIAGTTLAGELPDDDGERPTVGVFLNDGSGAKLGYYLTQAADLAAGDCRVDGRRELRLVVTLGSTAPRDGLPPSVLGLGLAGDPYTIRTHVLIFSPAGGAVGDVRLDGAPAMVGSGTERNRAVGVVTVDLAPGATRVIEATLLTPVVPVESTLTPDLWLTPAVTPWDENVSSEMVCPI